MAKTILYIEDNEQNLYLITFLLKAQGFDVVQARSGEEGISLAGQRPPDLILLDIQLPGMDGYEIARQLRLNPSLQAIPIVAVTSYAMVGDKEKALAAGCDGYIEKPIDVEKFPGQLREFLKGKREKLRIYSETGLLGESQAGDVPLLGSSEKPGKKR